VLWRCVIPKLVIPWKDISMGELSSKFTRDDIETLIESIGDWEMVGEQDYHLLQAIEDSPMPPEDHEAYEIMVRVKEHYRDRKQRILDHRAVRQEKAVFLKAKLMLIRKDMDINSLFEVEEDKSAPKPLPRPSESEPKAKLPTAQSDIPGSTLELAEFFIKDLGVLDHYQKFLADQAEKS
jgi:hypothetical protein